METTIINDPLTQWVERSRIGDRDAFEKIVRRYQQIVSGVTFGILGDFHKSEDIAQETFLIAWKKLDQLEDAAKLPGWLCQIARNLSKQHLLKKAGKTTTSLSETQQAIGVCSKEEDPMELAIREERSRLIWDAVGKIPEKYRIPLILYYRSEKSTPAIAAALEISEDTLSMRLSRAKKYLRKELEKQVEGAISSSGPGEFFSLAVVAALPALISVSSTGKAVAATEGTLVVAGLVAAPKSGPSGATLFGGAFFGIFGSFFLWIVSGVFFALFLLLAAIPGIWFSVRNAPTLRTRRYLILCSLRANLLIAFASFLVWAFFPTCQILTALMKYCGVSISHETEWAYINKLTAYGFGGALYLGIVVFTFVSPWVYRRILREDTGLSAVKKPVPLEESSLSLARLEKTYKLFSTVCLVMLVWYFACRLLVVALLATGVIPGRFEWSFGYFLNDQGIFVGFLLVGIVFYTVFRRFHKRLLDTAKDETTFQAVGPVWDRNKTPFFERVFVEWLVYFGCFVAAGVIVSLKPAISYDWVPYYPIPLTEKLRLILGVSFAAAALNAVCPKLRWLFISGGCLFATYGINAIFTETWGHGRHGSYLNTVSDWPYVFGVIFMNLYVAAAVFATLFVAGLHYYVKWNGKAARISLPKKIAVVYCVLLVLFLCLAPRSYSSLRGPYWYNQAIFNGGDCDPKTVALCDEVIRTSPEKSETYLDALGRRGTIFMNIRQYDKALADFDAFVQICRETKPDNGNRRYNISKILYDRANVKFVTGDLNGALADYTESLEIAPYDSSALYNRGYIYEKLGETEKAIADYTTAINLLERNQQYPWTLYVDSLVPRPGYDDANHRDSHLRNGYRISLDELKTIRDDLRK